MSSKDRYVVKVPVNNDVYFYYRYFFDFDDILTLSSTIDSEVLSEFVFSFDLASDIVKILFERFGIVSFIFNFDEV